MLDKAQRQNLSQALGLITMGVGLFFLLLARQSGRIFGMNAAASEQAGSLLALRIVGVRDLAFGAAIFGNRNRPAFLRQWLRFFAWCQLGDFLACVLASNKPEATIFTKLGAVSAVGVGALCLLADQEKEK